MQLPLNVQKYKLFEFILFFIALFYYLFFINKGLVLFDEGYFVHAAERILNSEIPYKDFSLQYGPLHFYALAFFFKIFGASIIVGRFFALSICLSILVTTFLILNKLRATSYSVILLSFLSIIAFGYPLINIPSIMWANVLASLLITLAYLHWFSGHKRQTYIYLVIMGTFLAMSLCLKQNIGLVSLLLFNFLVFFSKKHPLFQAIKDFLLLNAIILILTIGWIYFFFLRDNISGLLEVIEFSRKFVYSMAFTIPPITYITKPFGIFKLLPYYTPIFYAVFLFGYLFRRTKDWQKLAFSLMSVTGFAITIFPQSDLLHVYPFFGSILVSLLVFGYKSRLKFFLISLIFVHILIGFYLTFFTKSYRYESYYSQTNTQLPLPRTSNILVEKMVADNLIALSYFIKTHTKQNEYILAYPYSPMLYFILERKNPTKDPIYFLRNWHFYDDTVILKDMKQKNVQFIVVSGAYKFDADLSRFIQKQKKVFSSGNLLVYRIISWK